MNVFQILDSKLDLDLSIQLGPSEASEEVVWQQEGHERWLSLDNIRHGRCESHAEGIKGESYYWMGELHGVCSYYNAEGMRLSQCSYIHGKKWGPAYFWYAKGCLARELHYKDDKLEGEQLYYWPEGALRTQIYYKEGRADGFLRHYYASGQMAREAFFESGLKEKEDRTWYENGALQSQRCFQKGAPIGRSLSWYESAQLAQEIEHLSPSWKFHYKRFQASGQQIAEGISHEDGSFEEKKFSSENKLTEHRIVIRDPLGKVLEEKFLFKIENL
jgi:antitoxin component YwqK of YwqJK toxin-antitoxin module